MLWRYYIGNKWREFVGWAICCSPNIDICSTITNNILFIRATIINLYNKNCGYCEYVSSFTHCFEQPASK